MKRKERYITADILPACLSTHPGPKKDIHAQLEETIAERKRIIAQWESSFTSKPAAIKKDIYAQLAETIAERKRIIAQWEKSFPSKLPGIKKETQARSQETNSGEKKYGSDGRDYSTEQKKRLAMPDKKAA